MADYPKDYRIGCLIDHSDVVSSVLEVIWEHANFYDDRNAFHDSTAAATRGLMAAWACRWYECEVNNGGHDQFFNSTGMVWEEALVGTMLFELPDHRAVLESAIGLFPNGGPSFDREERIQQLDLVDGNVVDSLDDRFYELGSFDEGIEKYIADHPSEFFLPQ